MLVQPLHSYLNSLMHCACATVTFIHEFSYAFLLAKRSDRREGPFIWAKHLIALLEKLHFARALSSIITWWDQYLAGMSGTSPLTACSQSIQPEHTAKKQNKGVRIPQQIDRDYGLKRFRYPYRIWIDRGFLRPFQSPPQNNPRDGSFRWWPSTPRGTRWG